MIDVFTLGITVCGGVLGLLIGSFLNVVIYRVPAGKSIVSPPSACPNCDHEIAWYDNIPVLSWLMLRGRCRDCHALISKRYPLVELGTGVFFAAVSWGFGRAIIQSPTASAAWAATLVLVAFLYLAAISVALAAIDLDVHKLPNAIVLPSYLVGVVLLAAASSAAGDFWPLLRAGIGLAALFAGYFLMALISPAGMGLGDVKLAGVLGLYLGWLGWGALAVGAFAAFILAGVYSAVLLLRRRITRKGGIPFGPWMLAGAWLGVATGNLAFDGYLSLFDLKA